MFLCLFIRSFIHLTTSTYSMPSAVLVVGRRAYTPTPITAVLTHWTAPGTPALHREPLGLLLVGFPRKQEPEAALVGRVNLLLLHPHQPLQGKAPVLSHGHVQVLGLRRPRRSPHSLLTP